jgi:hypothetical protein
MQIASSEQITRFERNLPWLAITAAVTPFVGLFGTVWGIIDAFHGLGTSGAATLRAVAPGISEALITTAAGLAAAIVMSRVIGLALAMVPLSAFVWAAFRIVPLSDRLSLWIVPALYFGIAFGGDEALRFLRRAYSHRNGAGLMVGTLALAAMLWLCLDISRTGEHDMATLPRVPQGVDDRAAVRWLMAERQRGEPLLAMHLTMPAIWWYGTVPISRSGATLPDGGRLFEVSASSQTVDCPLDQLRAALEGSGRAAFYLGFDQSEDFNALLLSRLSELGRLVTYRKFETGHAAVFDFRAPRISGGRAPGDVVDRPRGCVAIQAAGRW